MKPTKHKRRGAARFPGIVRHAEVLKCHRVHLYLVLSGKRTSATTIRNYKALLRKEGHPIPAEIERRAA